LNPLSRDALRSKFKKLAAAVLPGHRIAEVMATAERLEKLDDAAKWVGLLSVK
jgi:hypothetical protein